LRKQRKRNENVQSFQLRFQRNWAKKLSRGSTINPVSILFLPKQPNRAQETLLNRPKCYRNICPRKCRKIFTLDAKKPRNVRERDRGPYRIFGWGVIEESQWEDGGIQKMSEDADICFILFLSFLCPPPNTH
jgi:hypothetical protein